MPLEPRESDYVVTDLGYDTPCWIWQKFTTDKGYGWWQRGGHNYAHRAYYEIFKGPIPAGRQIDHLCRQRACCNPDHLEAVTAAVNIQRSSQAKLTPEDVLTIRQSDATDRELAKRFGVSHSTIGNVRRATTWSQGAKPTSRPRGKLTPEQVEEIRRSSLSSRKLAKKIGVSHTTINDVRSGKYWSNV